VIARARAIVESAVFEQAVTNPTCRLDVSLLAVIDDVVLDLIADLVCVTPDGITLVAYQIDAADSLMGAPSSSPQATAANLAEAFAAAAKRAPRTVEIIHATDGTCSHFEVAGDLRVGL
jgi:hypothetical protein